MVHKKDNTLSICRKNINKYLEKINSRKIYA